MCFRLNTLFVFSLFLMGFCAISCNKDAILNPDFADHTAEFAFPLFQTTFPLDEMVKNILSDIPGDTLLFNDDRTITLYYSGDVATKYATDLFTFFVNGLVPIPDTFYFAPYEAPDSLDIYKAIFKKGLIELAVYNSTTDTITGTFYVPQMTMNNQQFKIPFTAVPGQTFLSGKKDLNNWALASPNNTLFFRYEAYKPNGDRIKMPDIIPGIASVGIVFDSLEFSYLEGYWGNEHYPLDQATIDIEINNSNLQGNITVVDPKIAVIVENSFGFPTRGNIQELTFIGKDGTAYPLESAYVTSGIDFDYPKLALGEVGQSKKSIFYFDRTNSNIDDIFNAQPKALRYKIEGVANAAQDPNLVGFLTDNSYVKFSVQVQMTLEGTMQAFGADQTLEVDFSGLDNSDINKIAEAEFKLVTENEMPVAIDAQIYFQNANGVVIDSLFSSGKTTIMNAAPVDANGVVNAVERTETFIPISVDRIKLIKKAKKAFLQTSMTTTDGGNTPVKFLSGMKTSVKMGLKIKVERG